MDEAKKSAAVEESAKPEAKAAKPKRSWKKLARRIAVVSAILLVALVIFLWLLLDWTVAATVRNVAPMFTGTPVELKSVSIGILSGRVELSGFKVANPKGFAHEYAFELDKFVCHVNLPSALTKKIIVEEVTIDGMLADYEVSLQGSNLAQIQKNVESSLGKSEAKSADDDDKSDDDGKKEKSEKPAQKVVIRKLSVGGIKLASGVLKLPLPPIALNDLGEDSALGEVIDKFYVALMKSVGDALSSQAVQGLGDAAKNFGNVAGDAAKSFGNAAGDAGKSVTDGIKNLFNKK